MDNHNHNRHNHHHHHHHHCPSARKSGNDYVTSPDYNNEHDETEETLLPRAGLIQTPDGEVDEDMGPIPLNLSDENYGGDENESMM